MSNQKTTLLLLSVALLVMPSFAAQQKGDSSRCTAEYENHNQVDYGPLIVQKVTGTITDPQQIAMAKVCVAIFTEKQHRLLATTESDEEGKFSLKSVPPGQYRLVAKADPLCGASVPLRVVKHQNKRRALHLHMKPRGLDACSYGETIQAEKPSKNRTTMRPAYVTKR